MSIHDMCPAETVSPLGSPLDCMRSKGHAGVHRDVSVGYTWTDGSTPVFED
jgi:hypothetical protein